MRPISSKSRRPQTQLKGGQLRGSLMYLYVHGSTENIHIAVLTDIKLPGISQS